MKKGQLNKQRGMALIIVFMVLILLAGLSLAMFEVGVSTSKLSQSWVAMEDAGYFARMGIHYFAHQIISGELNNSNGVLQELQKFLGKKKTFGMDSGWFRLDFVEKVELDYLIRISGGSLNSTKVAQRVPMVSFVNSAYAGDSQVIQFEALIGPRMESGYYGLLTAKLTNSGVQNNLTTYEGKGIVLAPTSSSLKYEADQFQWTSDEKMIQSTIELAAPPHTKRISEAFEAFTKGFQDSNFVGSLSDFNTQFPRSGNFRHVPAGKYHFSLDLHLDSSAAFGSPNSFSYMKFSELELKNPGQVVRFYPGIYQFDKLEIESNQTSILMDTTTGPVYFIITDELEIKGDYSSLIVFKDSDYDQRDYNQYSEKVDLPNRGKESPLKGLEGRKIAQIFLMTSESEEGKVEIEGSSILLGALAIGPGGGKMIALPSGFSTLDGSEVYQRQGKNYLLTGPSSPSYSTEQFQVWGKGGTKMAVDSSGGISLVGNFIFVGLDPKISSIDLSGQNTRVFGVAITNSLSLTGSHSLLSLDSRAAPLPPQPIPGSIYIKYSRQIR